MSTMCPVDAETKLPRIRFRDQVDAKAYAGDCDDHPAQCCLMFFSARRRPPAMNGEKASVAVIRPGPGHQPECARGTPHIGRTMLLDHLLGVLGLAGSMGATRRHHLVGDFGEQQQATLNPKRSQRIRGLRQGSNPARAEKRCA